MRVEPTGNVSIGVCQVRTPACRAIEPGPLTSVHPVPSRGEVHVCRPCLEEQVRDGVWEIPGARIRTHFDVAVDDAFGRPRLIVEVKAHRSAAGGWNGRATAIHRNLLVHGGIPAAPHFLLVGYPDAFFVWTDASGDPGRAPDHAIVDSGALRPYRAALEQGGGVNERERVVAAWLDGIVHRERVPAFGAIERVLSDLLRGAAVVRTERLAA